MSEERLPHLRLELASALLLFLGLAPLTPLLDLWASSSSTASWSAHEAAPYHALFLVQVWLFAALSRRFRGESWGALAMPRFRAGLDLCFGAFVFCAGYAITVFSSYLLVGLERAGLPLVHEGTGAPPVEGAWPLVVIGLLGVVCTSIGEELFYRGYLLKRLTQATGGAGNALVLSSLLFGLAHTYQGLSAPLSHAAWGFLLGVFVLVLGRVWPAAVAHVLQNLYLEAVSLA